MRDRVGDDLGSNGRRRRCPRAAARRDAAASTATAGILILAKLVAWLMTGSSSLLASLTDSLMDISASLINLFALRYSLTPADHDHSFGHGKAESLASLAQAAVIRTP